MSTINTTNIEFTPGAVERNWAAEYAKREIEKLSDRVDEEIGRLEGADRDISARAEERSDSNLAEAKAYSDSNLIKANTYSDSNLAKAKVFSADNLSEAKEHSDGNLAEAKAYSDGNLAEAKAYSNCNLATAKVFSADNLSRAKAYTDTKHGEAVSIAETAQDTADEAASAAQTHRTENVLDHPDGSVTTEKLADGAVTAEKLSDGAVTAIKIYKKLSNGTSIDNLDDGFYTFGTGGISSDSALPFIGSGILFQICPGYVAGGYIMQMIVHDSGDAYKRYNDSTAWSGWTQLSGTPDGSITAEKLAGSVTGLINNAQRAADEAAASAAAAQETADGKLGSIPPASLESIGGIKLHYGTVNGQKVNRSGIAVDPDTGSAYIATKTDGGISRTGSGELYIPSGGVSYDMLGSTVTSKINGIGTVSGVAQNAYSMVSDLQTYSTTPVRIGTWIDGTPVWRMAFYDDFRNYSEFELDVLWSDMEYVATTHLTDYKKVIVLDGYASLFRDYPCVVDDYPCSRFNFHFEFPSVAQRDIYNGIYGWLEFVTPENNFKTA